MVFKTLARMVYPPNGLSSIANPESEGYQICKNCIMDTSDPEITFNHAGRCNHCSQTKNYSLQENKACEQVFQRYVDSFIAKVKYDGKGKPYDCIIGVSGGVDSSYVAWLVKEKGLRPLAIHLDNGWNSEVAVKNIHTLLKILNIDLYTHILDWEEFKDLQIAFLKSSTPDLEIPSDHAIVALNYKLAQKYKINYFINGSNYQTESIMPRLWSQGHADWNYIKSIHEQFGTRKLKSYPHYSWCQKKYYSDILGIKWFNILEYINYRKLSATQFLKDELGWIPYGVKHGESIYTRFYQEYILPRKFNADKRRAHLSNLITNGEITREEALSQLEEGYPDTESLEQDKFYVIKKLGISLSEFEIIMNTPPMSIHDYNNSTYSPIFEKLETYYTKIKSLI